MAKAVAKDVFMQFAALTVGFATPTNDLAQAKVDTGLSIRGGIAWLIHCTQWWVDSLPAQSFSAYGFLGTRELSAQPEYGHHGLIDSVTYQRSLTTEGATGHVGGAVRSFTPPIPIAAPQLWLSVMTLPAQAALQGQTVGVRLGYTTVPLEAALWAEIAEVWGW